MVRFLMAVAVTTLVGGLAMAGDIINPQDGTSFPVKQGDIVRITAGGIAGTKVEVKVTGPAKETISDLSIRRNGKKPLGVVNNEVDVKPTGKGVVKVKVTITQPNGKAQVMEYEFEVVE